MYYYEVTIYLTGSTEHTATFKIDESEIHDFIRFITDNVNNLFIINVVRRTVYNNHGGV